MSVAEGNSKTAAPVTDQGINPSEATHTVEMETTFAAARGDDDDHASRDNLIHYRWKVGLWSCFGDCVPNGCMSFLCPCVVVAQISARIGMASYSLVLGAFLVLYLLVGLSIGIQSRPIHILTIVGAAVAIAYVSFMRYKLRLQFEIPGMVKTDVGSALCCGPCTVAQMATQVESYKPRSCSFGPRATLQGYPGP